MLTLTIAELTELLQRSNMLTRWNARARTRESVSLTEGEELKTNYESYREMIVSRDAPPQVVAENSTILHSCPDLTKAVEVLTEAVLEHRPGLFQYAALVKERDAYKAQVEEQLSQRYWPPAEVAAPCEGLRSDLEQSIDRCASLEAQCARNREKLAEVYAECDEWRQLSVRLTNQRDVCTSRHLELVKERDYWKKTAEELTSDCNARTEAQSERDELKLKCPQLTDLVQQRGDALADLLERNKQFEKERKSDKALAEMRAQHRQEIAERDSERIMFMKQLADYCDELHEERVLVRGHTENVRVLYRRLKTGRDVCGGHCTYMAGLCHFELAMADVRDVFGMTLESIETP